MQSRSQRFAVLYGLAALNGAGATASLLSLWLHWRDTLGHCAKVDCSCILYAVKANKDILGGASIFCKFTTFAPLPAACIATALAIVHFYWGFIRTKRRMFRVEYGLKDNKHPQPVIEIRRLQTVNRPVPLESNRKPAIGRLALQVALAGIVSVVQIGQVAILTDGYNVTCREYRKTVMSILDASGSLASMINSRMLCTTVFDFLDYTKPDFHKIYGPDVWTPSGRPTWDPGLMNSGAAFACALVFSYLQMFLWIAVGVFSAMETRKVTLIRERRRKHTTHDRGPMMNTAL